MAGFGWRRACPLEAGRRARVGLGLIAVDDRRVVDVGAKAGLRGVIAGAALVATEGVQPSVGFAAVAKVVEQLHMSVSAWHRSSRFGEPGVDIDGDALAARNATEVALVDVLARGVDEVSPQRQFVLVGCHRCR